jgi:hypothetical protein
MDSGDRSGERYDKKNSPHCDMKGLEISKLYFEAYGRAMLEGFKDLEPFIAVGLIGSGSECLGYDDDVSKDHDFEPGFCIFIPGEDIVSRRDEFLLQRAYDKLPKEFMGCSRSIMAPAGGRRHGVLRIDEFIERRTGVERFIFGDGSEGADQGLADAQPVNPLSNEQWLNLPEEYLLEAVNGEVFYDNYGQLSAVRAYLSAMPENVRLKKLAGALMMMSQSGCYNYRRCLSHGERGAAQLAVNEFVERAVHAVYLLNRSYMPYYKWWLRGMRELPVLGSLSDTLEAMLLDPLGPMEFRIESVISAVTKELAAQGLSDAEGDEPEKHAQSVNEKISDIFLRNADLLIAE